jgi:hypothetical protein
MIEAQPLVITHVRTSAALVSLAVNSGVTVIFSAFIQSKRIATPGTAMEIMHGRRHACTAASPIV